VTDGIRSATSWRPGELPRDGLDGPIRWLDLAPDADAAEVQRLLGDGVTVDEVRHVLEYEEKERHCVQFREGDVRLARAFSIEVLKDSLRYDPVNILAGDGWLATCWHEPGSVRALTIEAVTRRWGVDGKGRTAADLAVLVLHELVLTHTAGHHAIRRWVEDWELELYRHDVFDDHRLRELWHMATQLRRWVEPLDRIGVSDDLDKAWFRFITPDVDAKAVDQRIDRTLKNLGELSVLLRTGFAIKHARAEQGARDRQERRDAILNYVAALVVVPALVVGFYGANTKLPGGNTWWGFAAMIVAIVVLTALTFGAIALITRRNR
jgi:Mg2+ and Co2+ transporter CorA